MIRIALSSLLIVSLATLAGCGPKAPMGVLLHGRILKGGEPLPVGKDGPKVEIWVIPVDGKNREEVTEANENGAFTFVGETNRGVGAGKYKMAVYHRDNGPASDALDGVYSKQRTKIEFIISDMIVGGEHETGDVELDTYK